MNLIIKNNLQIIIIFLAINAFLVLIEKYLNESTSESMYFVTVLALIFSLFLINKKLLGYLKSAKVKVLVNSTVSLTFFVIYWTLVYFFNWKILYPVIN